MRIRTRIALISAVAVAVVVVASVFTAHAVVRRQLLADIDQSLIDRVAPITGSPFAFGRPMRVPFLGEGVDALLGRAERGFDALFVQYVAPDGTAVVPVGQPVTLPVGEEDLEIAGGSDPIPQSQPESHIRTVAVGDDRLRMITIPIPAGAFQMARSLDEFDSSVSGITGTLTVVGGIGVALAALLGLAVARSALRPLDELTDTVEHVTETRELAPRITITRGDEVGRLGRSFNAMLEALEASRAQQHQLVRDAGHELRTPLTALRTNIEVLARTTDATPEQRAELLEAAASELAELSDLAVELVELAADPDAVSEPKEVVALDAVAEKVVDRFRRRMARPIELVTRPGLVEARPSALERAIGNLIDNADKWSPPDAPISVVVGAGRLAVGDAGSGIAPADRSRIFDRFYRAANARTTPGSGLGLAITKKIVEEHGGSVFADESPMGGALVGFVLPTV